MTSWNYKEESAKRRDARHIKYPEKNRPVAARKDTKHWCKGKVGVEHILKCMHWDSLPHIKNAKILACTKCGKHLDYYLPWPKRTPKPTWYVK